MVTVRHCHSDVLRRVRAELDRAGSELFSHGPTAVLCRTADLVVDCYEEAITSITEGIDEIETQVLGADGEDQVERISRIAASSAPRTSEQTVVSSWFTPTTSASGRGGTHRCQEAAERLFPKRSEE